MGSFVYKYEMSTCSSHPKNSHTQQPYLIRVRLLRIAALSLNEWSFHIDGLTVAGIKGGGGGDATS